LRKAAHDPADLPLWLVLLDVDEVLLDWFSGFAPFAEKILGRSLPPEGPLQFDMTRWLGFTDRRDTISLVRSFNDREETGSDRLKPIPGAVEGVAALKEFGYRLVVVTSFTDHPASVSRRQANLDRVFGIGAFEDMVCIPLGGCKRDSLAKFPSGAWIDDLPGNVLAGHAAGHDAAVLDAHHNTSERDAFMRDHGLPWLLDWGQLLRSLDPEPVRTPDPA